MITRMKIDRVAKNGGVLDVENLAHECYVNGDYSSYAYLWISFAQRAWACRDSVPILGGEDKYFLVGEIYERGVGVARDYQEAMKWYQRAAYPNGPFVVDPDGLYKIGYFYEHGLGVPRDISEAINYYRRAASCGSSAARQALDALS